MKKRWRWSWTWLALLVVGAGCVDSTAVQQFLDRLADLPRYAGLVVVGSDYQSTTLSLVDADGNLVAEAFLTSGSAAPELSTALSGDVVVARNPNPTSTIVVIDRFNSVLTWVDGTSRAVLAQATIGEAGYGVNPHDYLEVGAGKAYVSRYNPVFADDGSVREGDDLAILDLERHEVVGRIPLTEEAAPVPGTTFTAYARPDRLFTVDGLVYVLLQSMTLDFKVGPTVVAVVDPETDTVIGRLELDGIKNCNDGVWAADVTMVYLVCSGAFSDGPAGQLAGSAVVAIDVSEPRAPRFAAAVTAGDLGDGDAPLGFRLGYLGGAQVAVVALGSKDWGTGETLRSDRILAVDLSVAPATSTVIYEGGAFDLTLFADPVRGRIYVGDAAFDAPRLLLFDAEGERLASTTFATALPPRLVAGY